MTVVVTIVSTNITISAITRAMPDSSRSRSARRHPTPQTARPVAECDVVDEPVAAGRARAVDRQVDVQPARAVGGVLRDDVGRGHPEPADVLVTRCPFRSGYTRRCSAVNESQSSRACPRTRGNGALRR